MARALPPFTGWVHTPAYDGKAIWTNEKLPLAQGLPANPTLVYPGLESPDGGGIGRQDIEEPTTWAPAEDYRVP